MAENPLVLRPRNLDQLAAGLRRTVALEIRQAGLVNEPDPYVPLPADCDAEAEVLSAALDGHIVPGELAPLEPKHFYADVHGAVWAAALECAPGDAEGILRALTTRGWRGNLAAELHRLELGQPWCNLRRLRQHAERIVELWRQRKTIEVVQRLHIDLRRGSVTPAEALERLAAVVREVGA